MEKITLEGREFISEAITITSLRSWVFKNSFLKYFGMPETEPRGRPETVWPFVQSAVMRFAVPIPSISCPTDIALHPGRGNALVIAQTTEG